MIQSFNLNGMTCGSCEQKLSTKLRAVEGVKDVVLSREEHKVIITFEGGVTLALLKDAITPLGSKYSIESDGHIKSAVPTSMKEKRTWFETYKPIIIIFLFIVGVTQLIQFNSDDIDVMEWVRHFMAGFFLVFSFFKLLNLRGFAISYAMYDIIAKKVVAWDYIYPFVELVLGIMYLTDFDPIMTNGIALVVMSISIVGVLQSVLNKRVIQCACLGDVFNLPMSTVTIIEDGLMIVMSLTMLVWTLNI